MPKGSLADRLTLGYHLCLLMGAHPCLPGFLLVSASGGFQRGGRLGDGLLSFLLAYMAGIAFWVLVVAAYFLYWW